MVRSTGREFDVVTVGETMAMVTPATSERLVDAVDFRLEVGGAESNLALHLSALGHAVAWVSRLGDDPLGERVRRVVEAGGVDTSSVVLDPGAPTGVYFKDPSRVGTRVHYYRAGSAASRMNAGFLSHVPVASARLVHLSGITPALSPGCAELVDAIIAEAQRNGVPVSFDVNYRPGLWPIDVAAPTLERIVAKADIVFVGRDEAELLWGTRTADQIHDRLRPSRQLIVKDGEVGATEYHDGSTTFVPALPVEVLEAVGAGDAFAAGYLSGVLGGLPADESLMRGHVIAARALTTMSAFPSGA
jgi:2-dehydro-3-deoxygluconokinase